MRNGFSVTAERVFGLSWGQFCDLTLVDLFGLFYSEALRKRRLIEEGRGREGGTDRLLDGKILRGLQSS